MLMNLPQILKSQQTSSAKPKIRKFKPIKSSIRTQMWYQQQLVGLVKSMRQRLETAMKLDNVMLFDTAVNDKGIPAFNIDRFLSALKGMQAVGIDEFSAKTAREFITRGNEQNARELTENVKRQTGVDLQGYLQGSAKVNERLEQLTQANVALIGSIHSQYLDKVQNAVLQAQIKGELNADLAKKIREIGGVTENRAKLIARDQTAKVNAALTRARHEELGVTHYRWSTSGDERVRDTHAELDGKIFAYDDPPSVGNPGDDFNCRCVAIPVFDKKEIEQAALQEVEKDVATAFYPDVYQFQLKQLAEPLVKAEIEKYRLSMPEAVSIREYTANGYAKLNAELRAGKESSQTKAFARLLNKALDKLPNFVGEVWRDVDLPEKVLANYVVGKMVTEKAFTSSTYEEEMRHNDSAKHRLLIHSKKGKYIKNISANNLEKEVLFKSRSKFKVIKRTQMQEFLLIELQEI